MKIAIVTGASSGMGRLFTFYAPFFYSDIEEIWLIGRNTDRLEKVAKRCTVKTKVYSMDLNVNENLNALNNDLSINKPEISLLVNSAGMGIIGSFETLDCEDIHNMVSTNTESLTKVISICLDYMAKDSTIINLASSAAFIPQPDFAVYAATKSYVLSLSDALYKEFKKRDIHVMAVCPGCVDTPFFNVAEKYSKIKPFKRFFMAKDKAVVIKAYKDAKAKKIHSIYGVWMKLFYIACKFLPEKFIMSFIK